MKVLMKPIQVYALWKEDGGIVPLAFCLENDDEKYKYTVDQISCFHEDRFRGRRVVYFECLIFDGYRQRTVLLWYDIIHHCWYLYKA